MAPNIPTGKRDNLLFALPAVFIVAVIVLLALAFNYVQKSNKAKLKTPVDRTTTFNSYIRDIVALLGGASQKQATFPVLDEQRGRYVGYALDKTQNLVERIDPATDPYAQYSPDEYYFNTYTQQMLRIDLRPVVNTANHSISYTKDFGFVDYSASANIVVTSKEGDAKHPVYALSRTADVLCENDSQTRLPVAMSTYKNIMGTKNTRTDYTTTHPSLVLNCVDAQHPQLEVCPDGEHFDASMAGGCSASTVAKEIATTTTDVESGEQRRVTTFAESDAINRELVDRLREKSRQMSRLDESFEPLIDTTTYMKFKADNIRPKYANFGLQTYDKNGHLTKTLRCDSSLRSVFVEHLNDRNLNILAPRRYLDIESGQCETFPLLGLQPIYINLSNMLGYKAIATSFSLQIHDDGQSHWTQSLEYQRLAVVPMLDGKSYLHRHIKNFPIQIVEQRLGDEYEPFIIYRQVVYRAKFRIPKFTPILTPTVHYHTSNSFVICAIGGNVIDMCVLIPGRAPDNNGTADEERATIDDDFSTVPSVVHFRQLYPKANYHHYSTAELYGITVL